MLKVNVGMSRKVSRDYNSTGFSVSLEGELSVSLDDPAAVIEKIKEFYDVAEETLAQQIERYDSESAIAQREGAASQSRISQSPSKPSTPLRPADKPSASAPANENSTNGNPSSNGNGQTVNGDQATNKQIQFLLNLGKRQGLNPQQVEQRVEEILGHRVGVYQLSKREAGQVIDVLNENGSAAANGTARTSNGR